MNNSTNGTDGKQTPNFLIWQNTLLRDEQLLKLASKSDRDIRVTAMVMAGCFGKYGQNLCPKAQTVAGYAGCDERTVRNHMKELVGLGWFTAEKRPGKTTIYTITFPHQDSNPGNQGFRGTPEMRTSDDTSKNNLVKTSKETPVVGAPSTDDTNKIPGTPGTGNTRIPEGYDGCCRTCGELAWILIQGECSQCRETGNVGISDADEHSKDKPGNSVTGNTNRETPAGYAGWCTNCGKLAADLIDAKCLDCYHGGKTSKRNDGITDAAQTSKSPVTFDAGNASKADPGNTRFAGATRNQCGTCGKPFLDMTSPLETKWDELVMCHCAEQDWSCNICGGPVTQQFPGTAIKWCCTECGTLLEVSE